MTKYFCDRCNKEIIGSIYRVKIYAENKSKSTWDELSGTVDYHAAITNMTEVFVEQPMYCQNCKEKFEDFLRYNTLKE